MKGDGGKDFVCSDVAAARQGAESVAGHFRLEDLSANRVWMVRVITRGPGEHS